MSNESQPDHRRKRGERNIRIKQRVASVADSVGLWSVMRGVTTLRSRRFVRALNYHGTPAIHAKTFEQQLAYFQQHYVNCGVKDLIDLLDGNWPHAKPGLIISFDDGMANNAEIAAPLLEQYGFIGWFLIPPTFINVPASQQSDYAREWEIDVRITNEVQPVRAMTWDQIRELDQAGHVIGSHTMNHRRLQEHLNEDVLHQEIVESKRVLEDELKHDVNVFSWMGGRLEDYSHRAAQKIHEAGYQFSLMTNSQAVSLNTNPLQIQRTHLEAAWGLPLVRMQLSGAIDLLYRKKRRIVEERTQISSTNRHPITDE